MVLVKFSHGKTKAFERLPSIPEPICVPSFVFFEGTIVLGSIHGIIYGHTNSFLLGEEFYVTHLIFT